jgi:hypothetical protein
MKLIHELRQVLPFDKDDVILLDGFFEFRAGDLIMVAWPPGRTVVRVI